MPKLITASNQAVLVAARGLVSIKTGDGRIVITPQLARSLVRDLARYADLAESPPPSFLTVAHRAHTLIQ